MFDVAASLQGALERARTDLHQAETAVVRANAGGDAGRSADAAMAESAKAAIFTEALLAAEHARLQEIKGVTR